MEECFVGILERAMKAGRQEERSARAKANEIFYARLRDSDFVSLVRGNSGGV